MPQAAFKALINAPYATVRELLIDKISNPKKYLGFVEQSRVLGKGDGYILREMCGSGPNGMVIREKIYIRPSENNGEAFVFEFIDNESYTGSFLNILTAVAGDERKCEVEYVMDWKPLPGIKDSMPQIAADRMVSAAVEHLKDLAEHPPEVPAWVREFYAAVDSNRPDVMASVLAENVRFRLGSNTEITGRDNMVRACREASSYWTSIKHHFADIYHDRGKTFCECWVEYILPNGKDYLLPMLSVIDHDGMQITSIRIFGDMSPLIYGWTGKQ